MEEWPDLLTDPRALRDGYLEQLDSFNRELERGCRMHETSISSSCGPTSLAGQRLVGVSGASAGAVEVRISCRGFSQPDAPGER